MRDIITKHFETDMRGTRKIVIFRSAGGYVVAGVTNGKGKYFRFTERDTAAADSYILEILHAVRDGKDEPRKWQRKRKPPRRKDSNRERTESDRKQSTAENDYFCTKFQSNE